MRIMLDYAGKVLREPMLMDLSGHDMFKHIACTVIIEDIIGGVKGSDLCIHLDFEDSCHHWIKELNATIFPLS